MKRYELAIILHPDLEIDLPAALKRVEALIDAAGVKIIQTDNWGKQKLAYPVSGQAHGIYLFYVADIDPQKVAELEEKLRIDEEVIRHLIVNYVDVEAKNKQAKAKASKKKLVKAGAKVEEYSPAETLKGEAVPAGRSVK